MVHKYCCRARCARTNEAMSSARCVLLIVTLMTWKISMGRGTTTTWHVLEAILKAMDRENILWLTDPLSLVFPLFLY